MINNKIHHFDAESFPRHRVVKRLLPTRISRFEPVVTEEDHDTEALIDALKYLAKDKAFRRQPENDLSILRLHRHIKRKRRSRQFESDRCKGRRHQPLDSILAAVVDEGATAAFRTVDQKMAMAQCLKDTYTFLRKHGATSLKVRAYFFDNLKLPSNEIGELLGIKAERVRAWRKRDFPRYKRLLTIHAKEITGGLR